MLAHNSAMYHQTTRKMAHANVLSRKVAVLKIDTDGWSTYCVELYQSGRNTLQPANLPLRDSRVSVASRIAASRHIGTNAIRRSIQKKPATKKPAANSIRVQLMKKPAHFPRRTPFTLKRVN